MTRPLVTYLAGSFLARLADEGLGVAAALLALERTGSAAGGAAVLSAWMAPHVFAAPAAGALAARTARPQVLYAAAVSIAAVTIAATGVFLGRVPLPVMLVAAAFGGCCGPLVSGGLSSAVSALTSPQGRPRAYALDSATYTAATLAGPVVVAAAAAAWSPGAAMLLLAASAAIAAPLLGSLRLAKLAAPVNTMTLRRSATVGITTLWRNRVLRGVTAGTSVAYLGMGALPVAAVLTAWSWGAPRDGGLLMTAFAAGGLAGALVMTRWRPAAAADRLAGLFLLGAGGAFLAAATAGRHAAITLILFAAAGACDGPLLTATLEVRSQYAPEHVRPQVFTMGAALKISAAAIGAALIGLFSQAPPRLLLLAIAGTELLGYAALRLLPRFRHAHPADAPSVPGGQAHRSLR